MPVKKGASKDTTQKKEESQKKKEPQKKKESKKKEPSFTYGVNNIAEQMETSPVAVRGMLRRRGVEKAGKSYGWNTQKELDAVIKEISEKPAKKEKEKDKD